MFQHPLVPGAEIKACLVVDRAAEAALIPVVV